MDAARWCDHPGASASLLFRPAAGSRPDRREAWPPRGAGSRFAGVTDGEHLVQQPWAVRTSSSEKCLFGPSAHFQNGLFL